MMSERVFQAAETLNAKPLWSEDPFAFAVIEAMADLGSSLEAAAAALSKLGYYARSGRPVSRNVLLGSFSRTAKTSDLQAPVIRELLREKTRLVSVEMKARAEIEAQRLKHLYDAGELRTLGVENEKELEARIEKGIQTLIVNFGAKFPIEDQRTMFGSLWPAVEGYTYLQTYAGTKEDGTHRMVKTMRLTLNVRAECRQMVKTIRAAAQRTVQLFAPSTIYPEKAQGEIVRFQLRAHNGAEVLPDHFLTVSATQQVVS